MAAARVYDKPAPLPSGTSILLWSSLSLLPDADVVGMALGIPYEHPLGHRGATHSFAFAVIIAVIAYVITRRRRRPAVRAAVVALVVTASHAMLDTLTNGGLGCALFWPFDTTRYFAPWTPIPVSPIGLAYFSFYGMIVAATETVCFSPIFLYGLWPFVRAR